MEEKSPHFPGCIWALCLKNYILRRGPFLQVLSYIWEEGKTWASYPCPDHFEAVTEGGWQLRSDPLSAMTWGPSCSSRDAAGFHCSHQKITAPNADTQEVLLYKHIKVLHRSLNNHKTLRGHN